LGSGGWATTLLEGRSTIMGGEGEGGGDEGWGGGKGGTMPYMDLERLTFNIDYEAFKQ
jgi:hypothetical protein